VVTKSLSNGEDESLAKAFPPSTLPLIYKLEFVPSTDSLNPNWIVDSVMATVIFFSGFQKSLTRRQVSYNSHIFVYNYSAQEQYNLLDFIKSAFGCQSISRL
jgi:hypothetical protein